MKKQETRTERDKRLKTVSLKRAGKIRVDPVRSRIAKKAASKRRGRKLPASIRKNISIGVRKAFQKYGRKKRI